MELSDYLEHDATGLAALIAAGEVSAEEVRAAATLQHELTARPLNAVVEWYDDPDPPLADGGPFFGVPFLRKDAGATEAGRLAEMGSRLMAGHRAATTSPYYERIRAAGFQVVGRSAVPEFAQHGTTESLATGATRNPLDPELSSGGSSGGAASAVRAGVVPVAHATDAAGSIRIPAAVTGLIGLKPTRDLVPASADRWNGLLTEFVLARSLRDTVACLRWLAVGSRAPLTDPAPTPRRLAVSSPHWADGVVDADVAAALARTAARFEASGIEVDEVGRPFDYEQLTSTWVPLFEGGVIDAIRSGADAMGRDLDDQTLEPYTLQMLERVASLDAGSMDRALQAAAAVADAIDERLNGYDLLLTPTLDQRVIPLGRMAGDCPLDQYLADTDAWFDRLYPANATGWPALSFPAPDVGGPPIGMQLIARPGNDLMLLAAAERQLGPDWTAAVVAPPAGS